MGAGWTGNTEQKPGSLSKPSPCSALHSKGICAGDPEELLWTGVRAGGQGPFCLPQVFCQAQVRQEYGQEVSLLLKPLHSEGVLRLLVEWFAPPTMLLNTSPFIMAQLHVTEPHGLLDILWALLPLFTWAPPFEGLLDVHQCHQPDSEPIEDTEEDLRSGSSHMLRPSCGGSLLHLPESLWVQRSTLLTHFYGWKSRGTKQSGDWQRSHCWRRIVFVYSHN